MIGIFDSGYGGLGLYKQLNKQFPELDFIYLGDNKRAPYGGHSKETIIEYSNQACDFLFNKGAQIIIFACYTASGLALRAIQQDRHKDLIAENKRVLGIIHPLCEYVTDESSFKKIGVVCTQGTHDSQSFPIEISKKDNTKDVITKACPLLAPLIECDWHNKPEAKMILKKYLKPLKSHNLDCLILGCTHYGIMRDLFLKYINKRTKVLNTEEIVANKLEQYIDNHPEIKLEKGGMRSFYTTENHQKFCDMAKKLYGITIPDKEIAKISLP